VLIGHFPLAIMVDEDYERMLVEIVCVRKGVGHLTLARKFRGERGVVRRRLLSSETSDLSRGVVCVILRFAVLTQYRPQVCLWYKHA